MKRFSCSMMIVVLVLTGLIAGCEISPDISSGIVTGASTIIGSLLTWAFERAYDGSSTTTSMLDNMSSLVAMVL